MKCPMETRENAGWLVDYASGKLDAATRAEFEEHLEACPACREFAGGHQAVWQALDAWEPAPVSMDFDRRLYGRIDQQVSWWARLLQPLNPLFRHAVPIGAAAARSRNAVAASCDFTAINATSPRCHATREG